MSNTTGARTGSRIALFVAGVLIAGIAAALFAASSAGAQQACDPYTKKCKPIVKPTVIRTDDGNPDDPEETTPPSSTPVVFNRRERLPFTGADLTLFAATGAAAIGTGTVIVRATRSRKGRS